MATLIFTLINIIYLTTGRRLYALRKGLAVAQTLEFEKVVPLIEEAIAHEIQTVDMENAWSRSRKVSKARGESFLIDNQIDALLGTIFSRLKEAIPVLDAADPIVVASRRILEQLFPEGVHPIISLPFEEQLIKNQTIVERLTGDLSDEVETTHIGPFVRQLAALNIQFSEQLERSKTKEITYDALEAARDRGNLYIRQIAAIIMGEFYQDNSDAADMRRALLAPYLEQVDRTRTARRGRRSPQDIDPNTGDEVASEEDAA